MIRKRICHIEAKALRKLRPKRIRHTDEMRSILEVVLNSYQFFRINKGEYLCSYHSVYWQ